MPAFFYALYQRIIYRGHHVKNIKWGFLDLKVLNDENDTYTNHFFTWLTDS